MSFFGQLDVNNAFLNGVLEEEVFTDKTLVCKLNKVLYGHKAAPCAWFEKLKSSSFHLGFIKLPLLKHLFKG